MRPVGIHTGAWRYPGAYADANFNFAHLKRFARTLERARFDAFFMADHLALPNMPMSALQRSHTATSFEPFTLLSALRQATEHIGLVATASTTFDAPFHIARRFASLDHISNGRSGWNIVTTSNPDAALNFGLDDPMEHDADEMEQWLETGGSDGFNVMFSWLPGGLDAFCEKVVPELQRRGLFRTEYEGTSLRENLGLQRPGNRFFRA